MTATEAPANSKHTIIDLLEIESSKAVGIDPGITTATYFTCDSISTVTAELKNKLLKIFQANPWLIGKLVKRKGQVLLQLHYSDSVSESQVDKVFSDNVSLDIDLTMSFPKISKAVMKNKSVMVERGLSLVNTDKPLMRVSVSHIKDNQYVLIYSLSHTIADGSTFYQIQNMLFGGDEVYPMNVKRHHDYSMKAAVGEENNDFVFTKTFMIDMIKGIVFGRKPQYFAYYINEENINKTKQEFKENNPSLYISTNDIVSSSFMRAIKARLAMLVVNFRNRFPGISTKDAGNYEGVEFYDAAIYNTPGGIRQSLLGEIPFKTRENKLPGAWERMTMRMAQVNNWASFSGGFNLPGCELKLHLPIVPSTIPCDIAVLFRPQLGRTAVLILSKTHNKDFYINNPTNPLSEYLGEAVSETVFD